MSEHHRIQTGDHAPGSADRTILEALLRKTTNPSIDSRYIRGFVDAYLGRPYADGIHPPHNNVVFVPLDADPYRTGWIDGQMARKVHNN